MLKVQSAMSQTYQVEQPLNTRRQSTQQQLVKDATVVVTYQEWL